MNHFIDMNYYGLSQIVARSLNIFYILPLMKQISTDTLCLKYRFPPILFAFIAIIGNAPINYAFTFFNAARYIFITPFCSSRSAIASIAGTSSLFRLVFNLMISPNANAALQRTTVPDAHCLSAGSLPHHPV